MPRIFAYIAHKNGVLDDSAAELAAAAKKIDRGTAVTAIILGAGPALDAACTEAERVYPELWKVSGESFSYPNAELIRQALMKIVPEGSITLIAHDHFGIDLAPGLSIKLNAAFVPDVTSMQPLQADSLQVVRQEFGGQVSAHVRCDVSSGAVITIRPGAFNTGEVPAAAGKVVDKSAEVGMLSAGRRYLETIAAETSDVDITKHAI